MARPSVIRTTDMAIKLWIHETSRVFHDRFNNEEDIKWFEKLITELISRTLK